MNDEDVGRSQSYYHLIQELNHVSLCCCLSLTGPVLSMLLV